MALTNYVVWSRSIVAELLDLLTDEDRDRVRAIVEENNQSRAWQDVRPQDVDAAVRFLCETPAKRHARWQKLHPDERLILWLRARSLGLQSANAIAFAERIADIEGMKYRDALRDTARSVLQFELLPPLEELWRSAPGEYD